MKYKKLLIFVTCLMFVAVLIVGTATLFTTAEIKVECAEIENSPEKVSDKSISALNYYKGKSLLFVNKDRLVKTLAAATPYAEILEVKKIYPNRISVKIAERKEYFALKSNDKYYILGKDFKVLKESLSPNNNIDGNPLAVMTIAASDYNYGDLRVNAYMNIGDGSTKAALLTSADKLLDFRGTSFCGEISLKVYENGRRFPVLTVKTVEGAKFHLFEFDDEPLLKIAAAYKRYTETEDKSVGEFAVVKMNDGTITVNSDYKPN